MPIRNIFAFITLLLFLPDSLSAQQVSKRILTDEAWQTDLDELFQLLQAEHRDLYHTTEREVFAETYREIQAAIPALNDSEIIVQFIRLAALAREGHTRLTLPLAEGLGLGQAHSSTPDPTHPDLVFRHLPVRFYSFAEGLFILAATAEYQHLVGKQVLQIGKTPAEEAMQRARTVAHFENESGYRLVAPAYLSVLEVLRGLDIVEGEEVKLKLGKPGEAEIITMPALPRQTQKQLFGLDTSSAVMSRQHVDKYYWHRFLPDERALYLQLNQINNAPQGPGLLDICAELDQILSENKADRFVLDLRNNFGGDNTYVVPLVELINRHPDLNQFGRFYCLIGRKTFSAAQTLVNELRQWTNVLFVGEPTGAAPNSYGDSVKKQLSNSGLTVRIATIYWRDHTGDERAPWTSPDISVPPGATDYFQGHDPALNICLQYTLPTDWETAYRELIESGGRSTAMRVYTRLALDWRTPQEKLSRTEKLLLELLKEN